MKKRAGESADGYIVEFYPLGNSVKVSAIDPVTLTEVSMVGSPLVPESQLAQLAVRKLLYVMGKSKEPPTDDGGTAA